MEDDYRDDYRNYRGDYRSDYRNYRDYDLRGGRRNYRNYRNDYYEELETLCEDMRMQYREIEDIAEMATNPQEKQMLMKISQAEKENYHQLKQIMNKSM